MLDKCEPVKSYSSSTLPSVERSMRRRCASWLLCGPQFIIGTTIAFSLFLGCMAATCHVARISSSGVGTTMALAAFRCLVRSSCTCVYTCSLLRRMRMLTACHQMLPCRSRQSLRRVTRVNKHLFLIVACSTAVGATCSCCARKQADAINGLIITPYT